MLRSPCLWVVVAVELTASTALASPLIHLQTDRPSYRLGETVWFRAHGVDDAPLLVELYDSGGDVAATQEFEPEEEALASGRLLIPDDLHGGEFHLVARRGSRELHRVPLEVYDLDLPRLDLELAILGDLHAPGDQVVASFRASDSRGKPVPGVKVHYLLSFDEASARDEAGPTDRNGHALLRIPLPPSARGKGTLSAGIVVRGKVAAIARPVAISSSVNSVEFFPEGGAVIPNWRQRFGILCRGDHGEAVAVEGRVVDDKRRTVASFETDAHGLGSTLLLFETDRNYHAVIDRPAGVDSKFPLAGPLGHPFALRVDEGKESLHVKVRGTDEGRVVVRLTRGEAIYFQTGLHVAQTNQDGPVAEVEIPRSGRRGLFEVTLSHEQRVLARRTIFLGGASPVEVELRPAEGTQLLPGEPVAFELLARQGGLPVEADLGLAIYQGAPSPLPSVALRSSLGSYLHGNVVPVEIFAESDVARDRRAAFLLVHGAYLFPPAGLELTSGKLPRSGVGRRLPIWQAPRPLAPASGDEPSEKAGRRTGRRGKTSVHNPKLERALRRAPYTRSMREVRAHRAVKLDVPPRALLRQRGLGRIARVRPQDVRVAANQVDTRRTLLWSGRVQTDSTGRARVAFRLNHVVSQLTWNVEGYAAATPVSARGILEPRAGFAVQFDAPRHLCPGDRFDIFARVGATDGSEAPIDIEFQHPDCLEPLLRTSLRFRPGSDSKYQRFRFAVKESRRRDDLAFRVITSRGLHRREEVLPFAVLDQAVELTILDTGRGRGEQVFTAKLPPDADRDSVRLHAKVLPEMQSYSETSLGRFCLRDLWDYFRWPRGCFEQFTSRNFYTLAALDSLHDVAAESNVKPEEFHEAYVKADAGFQRLMTHRTSDGAFSMFTTDRDPSIRATVIAVRHLALYSRLFRGRGRAALEMAVRWLERRLESEAMRPIDILDATMALHDIGRLWKGSHRVLRMEPASLHERAMLTACLANWPQDPAEGSVEVDDKDRAEATSALVEQVDDGGGAEDRGGAQQEKGESRDVAAVRAALLEENLDTLVEALPTIEAALLPGAGLLGSSGKQLSTEVLAVASLSLYEAGRIDDSLPFHYALLKRWGGGWVGSHASALAMRALTRMPPPPSPPDPEDSMAVDLDVEGFGAMREVVTADHRGPLELHPTLRGEIGDELHATLNIDSRFPKVYQIACNFRSKRPKPAPSAPFTLSCTYDRAMEVGLPTRILVHLSQRGKTTSSQVIARVALPPGCEVDRKALDDAMPRHGFAYWETADGYVDLYFAGKKLPRRSMDIPIVPRVEGHFKVRPSVTYPYYESGKEYYTEPLALRVINNFGATLTPDGQLNPGLPGNPRGGR